MSQEYSKKKKKPIKSIKDLQVQKLVEQKNDIFERHFEKRYFWHFLWNFFCFRLKIKNT